VLPSSVDYLAAARISMAESICDCDAGVLLRQAGLEYAEVSHFLLQYVVEREGKEAFKGFGLRFTNDNIHAKLDGQNLSTHEVWKVPTDYDYKISSR
jgi:hypothetical protein